MVEKHVLFYSNYCQFSKEVLNIIVRKNIRAAFVYVCVDDNKYKLPAYVDRVPVIVSSSKNMYTDDDVMLFLDTVTHNDGGGGSHPGKVKEDDLQTALYKGQLFSDMYSFIESEYQTDPQLNLGYSMIDSITRIETPPEGNQNKGRGSGIDTSSMDRLIENRDMDIKRILGIQNQNPNVN